MLSGARAVPSLSRVSKKGSKKYRPKRSAAGPLRREFGVADCMRNMATVDSIVLGLGGEMGSDIDALFKLPLGEFTSARNALVSRLKKAGQQTEAAEAKALAKPSVSAWVVNQLYWRHGYLFGRLFDAGERLRQAQTTQTNEQPVAGARQRQAGGGGCARHDRRRYPSRGRLRRHARSHASRHEHARGAVRVRLSA